MPYEPWTSTARRSSKGFSARVSWRSVETDSASPPRPLLEETQALGWRVLAEEPGREIVLGAVTQPWVANVKFQGLAADEFAAFDRPGYVKIAFTLAADPIDAGTSLVRTETRVVTTDRYARERFRRYWTFVSPGVRSHSLRGHAAR